MYHLAAVLITVGALFTSIATAQTAGTRADVRAFAAAEKLVTKRDYAPDTDELRQIAAAAEQSMAAAEYDTAAELFDSVVAAAAFARLNVERRHFVLSNAANVASLRSDFAKAHALYEQSSTLAPAGSDDWMGRLNASWFLGDLDDAMTSLRHIAATWPGELSFVSEWAMMALLAHARSHSAETEFDVLTALFDTSWQTDLGREPTALWLRLIELLAERELSERALAVVSRLRDPLAVVTILSDKRFAAIVDSAPDWFSVAEAIEANIIEARVAVADNPHLLAPAVELAEALLRAGRQREALLVIETHMARSALKSVIGETLDDSVSETVRALTTKALALIGLGRLDDAVTQLELAAEQVLPKDRVGDFLDVAQLQASLGQADSALRTLERIDGLADSARAQFVRFLAAHSRNDAAAQTEALDALVASADDAPVQAQRALLLAGRLDDAAQLLVRRLNDPQHRHGALLELQQMHEPAWPVKSLDWRAQAKELFSRTRVRDSVEASGAIVSNYELYRWN